MRGLDGAPTIENSGSSFNPYETLVDNNNNHYNTGGISTDAAQDPSWTRSKWLESAANFTPSRENYIEWCAVERNRRMEKLDKNETPSPVTLLHQSEIDAAEALTKLAINFRNRLGGAAS